VNRAANLEPRPVTHGRKIFPQGSARLVPSAEGYARWALLYDQIPNPLLAREERHLLPLLTGLRNRSILDLACGTGRWLERLTGRAGGWAVGVDCSIEMLRVAAKKDAISGCLTRSGCASLPFRSGVFDLAICSFSLGHILDLRSTVRELGRVTKPGADIFVSDLHPEAYARGWRVGFRDQSTAVQIETIPRTTEQIVHAFCSVGFELLTLQDLRLGDPERHIFEIAGKAESFQGACEIPAVLVCHFKCLTSPTGGRPFEVRATEPEP
jgi:ubiquinone/menaquinone biosynthesis C-methylase UbiE